MSRNETINQISLFERIERIAENSPLKVAISSSSGICTYANLNSNANILSHWLLSKSLNHESIVALCFPRSAELVVAQLGVMKSGHAFLPLDPENPVARIRSIVANAKVKYLITSIEIKNKLKRLEAPKVQIVTLEEIISLATDSAKLNPSLSIPASNLAYVIYTSGSMGEPKGVMIENKSLIHFTNWHANYYEISETDRCAMMSAPGFDASLAEIWPTLVSAATIAIPDDDTRMSPQRLRDWILSEKICVADVPTPLGELLMAESWPPQATFRALILGGDRLHIYPREGLPFKIFNNYGPTENTVTSTAGEIGPSTTTTFPHIGQVTSPTRLYILDENMNLVEAGVTGEICLGGDCLARGYLGLKEATETAFISDNISNTPGARIYRTGDLGFQDAEGNLHFVGRIGSQVKIRGNRVELGEITAVLKKNPFLADAFVKAVQVQSGTSHSLSLVAYIVPKTNTYAPTGDALQKYLRILLPSYMVPAHFMTVTELPLRTNGKVNAEALPQFNLTARAPRAEQLSKEELGIAMAWEAILGLTDISCDSNFFELGGNSLSAIQILARINEQFGVSVTFRDFFKNPTVRDFALILKYAIDSKKPLPDPILPRSNEVARRLSAQQEQIIFFQGMVSEGTPYHTRTSVRLRGPVSFDVLEKAICKITERHEILRTVYPTIDGAIAPTVLETFPSGAEFMDLSNLEAEVKESTYQKTIFESLNKHFNLEELPLIRWTLIQLTETEYDLIMVEHHIIHDGWTYAILMKELEEFYNAILANREANLPPLAIQYSDYANWQTESFNKAAMKNSLDFWKSRLSHAPPVTTFPLDFPRPAKQTFRGEEYVFELPGDMPARLVNLSQKLNVTLFSLMFTAYKLLLHKYSGSMDLCVGSAVANRPQIEIENLIGMFVNVIIIRTKIKPQASFRELLKEVSDEFLDATAHQSYPFSKLVQQLNIERSSSHNLLFQTIFSFHDSSVKNPKLGEAEGTVVEIGNHSAKQDLSIISIPYIVRDPSDRRIKMLWEYNSSLFKEETIARMSKNYLSLLNNIAENIETAIEDFPILSESEIKALERFSKFTVTKERPVEISSFQILERIWSYKNSEDVAVICGDKSITYRELISRAGFFALKLEALKIKPNDLVCVFLPRGIELITAELAVMMSGAAFLPMDTQTPTNRVASILQNAQVKAVLTLNEFQGSLPADVRILDISDEVPEHYSPTAKNFDSSTLAYVIFTSGSTGIPKGAMISRANIDSYTATFINQFDLTKNKATALVHSPAFDASLRDIWPTLATGGTIHIPSKETLLIAEDLRDWILNQKLSHVTLPTALVERLLQIQWPQSIPLKHMITGGEALKIRPGKEIPFLLHNDYGPTEATIAATSGIIDSSTTMGLPDIGSPVENSEVYILDSARRPVPIGAMGEIYIAGKSVGAGYLGQPELTAERFVPNLLSSSSSTMYRTGDMARWLADGRIEYCGRQDRQIKIRGFRIELGEIASKLAEHSDVQEAFACVKANSDQSQILVAYFIRSKNAESRSHEELRSHLAANLPHYMVPAYLVELVEFPVSQSGKIDEKELPLPTALENTNIRSLSQKASSKGSSTLENSLYAIWSKLLKHENFDVTDNFFDIGGHSLMLAEMKASIQSELGFQIPLVRFFEHTSVRSLALFLAPSPKPQTGVKKMVDASITRDLGQDLRSKRLMASKSKKLGGPQ